MALLPSGTVTFLFTDVEDSTGLVQDLGARYEALLAEHRSILRTAVSEASGREIDCRGEEFLFAFRRAKDAVVAAVAAQRSLAAHQWPDGREVLVRMGIHTGEPAVSDTGYLGLDVHRGARIGACGHGGQVLVSLTTRELVTGIEPPGVAFEDLGDHDLKGLRRPERLFQVVAPGLRSSFPRLRAAAEAPVERRFLGRERELAHAAVTAFRRSVNVPRTPSRRGGFAELGWEVCALAPLADPAAMESLGSLAAELFTAARSVVHVDRFLERLDQRKLERTLAEYRQMGVLSRRAREKADALAGQIADVRRLRERRRSVDLAPGSTSTPKRWTAWSRISRRRSAGARRGFGQPEVAVSIEAAIASSCRSTTRLASSTLPSSMPSAARASFGGGSGSSARHARAPRNVTTFSASKTSFRPSSRRRLGRKRGFCRRGRSAGPKSARKLRFRAESWSPAVVGGAGQARPRGVVERR